MTSATTTAPGRPSNPGLAPFDITGYQGVRGENFFHLDTILKRIVQQEASGLSPAHATDMERHISGFGGLVGGILDELAMESHKEGRYGEIVKYDRTGERIDEIRYCTEQKDIRRICYEYGIVNLDFHPDWKHAFTTTHRMALAYLMNLDGEAGITCPLAMTDGLILALKEIGTEEQKRKYLPLIAGQGSKSHFMAGQYVTERVGGSNVAANRTVARKGENGKWILNGEKWFCSNPGDLWVTTARIEGTNTIALFLVPRIKDDGKLNGCHLLRKKDIIGSKGKVTAEAAYEDAEAEELGRTAHGLANLMRYVIKTSRVHVAVSASAHGRRAYMEALAYANVREAYGRRLIEFPVVLRNLAEMHILQSAVTLVAFRNFKWAKEGHAVEQVVTPLLKLISTQHATWITHEAIMLHGGNGILGDFSILPRLHNDAIINETWEGTHNIIGEHTLKAVGRPKAFKAFEAIMAENLNAGNAVKALEPARASHAALWRRAQEMLALPEFWVESNRLVICDALYGAFALSQLIAEADRDGGGSVMTDFANGFGEIMERGRLGPAKSEGVFANVETMQRIVAY